VRPNDVRVCAAAMFLFFIFFGSAMLTLLLSIGCVRIWVEGHMPKIVLIARAHSISPSTILRKVFMRRQAQKIRTEQAGDWLLEVCLLAMPRVTPCGAA
jgi:hypothetical protein